MLIPSTQWRKPLAERQEPPSLLQVLAGSWPNSLLTAKQRILRHPEYQSGFDENLPWSFEYCAAVKAVDELAGVVHLRQQGVAVEVEVRV